MNAHQIIHAEKKKSPIENIAKSGTQATVALDEYLKPLSQWLGDPLVNEILIQSPGTVLIENRGGISQYDVPELNYIFLIRLAKLISSFSNQRLSETEPLLSAHLPTGERVQVILPPAVKPGHVIISIRKQTIADIDLIDYENMNFFKNVNLYQRGLSIHHHPQAEDQELSALLNEKKHVDFLTRAIELKKNIVVSGATSTGKTTFLNACLKRIPMYEHVVTLEDVPELKLGTDRLHTALFASKGGQGSAMITIQDLLQSSLRIRPDRIIMGELRGKEASDYLHAISTGHEGAISSIHAGSPDMVFTRLVHMVKLSGSNFSKQDIMEDLETMIDVVVQLKRKVIDGKFERVVSDIYFKGLTN